MKLYDFLSLLVFLANTYDCAEPIRGIPATFASYPDYKVHPCKRDCESSHAPMNCEYNFTVEWYNAMNEACGNCPFSLDDCYAPNCISANGVKRAVIVVNHMMPGPAIEVCQDDMITVNLLNKLRMTEGTSIHWHGVLQEGTPFMDGVSMITQCPILSNTYFQYRFRAYHPGTMWYHSHVAQQRIDGLLGALIVRHNKTIFDTTRLYDYDLSDHVILVNDWMNENNLVEYSPSLVELGAKVPASILINGRGIYKWFFNESNSDMNRTYVTPRPIFNVKKGFRYRFRIISSAFGICPIQVSIDNHNLTVIASDNHYIDPVLVVESLVLGPGERYDFVLDANQVENDYLMKFMGLIDCEHNRAFQTGILSYDNTSIIQSLNIEPTNLTYSDMNRSGMMLNPVNVKLTANNKKNYTQIDKLRSRVDYYSGPMHDWLINRTVAKKFYIGLEFFKIFNPDYPNEYYTSMFNQIVNQLPPYPALFSWDTIPKDLVCNDANRNLTCSTNKTIICSCIYKYEIEMNDIVELVIVDEAKVFTVSHTVHLHGMPFAVLSMDKLGDTADINSIKKLDESGFIYRNLNRPPIKDTIQIPSGGYAVIRFLANNPGTWMFHCHIEWHIEMGMSIIFKVGNSSDLVEKPTNWHDCGSYRLEEENNVLINSGAIKFVESIWLISLLILAPFF